MVETDLLVVAAAPRTERLGFHDDQIDVRLRPGIAPGAGAEQDNPLGVDLRDDGPDHPVQGVVRDMDHARFSEPEPSLIATLERAWRARRP